MKGPLKSVKDLCLTFPKKTQRQGATDNIAVSIFNPKESAYKFIQSKHSPSERYGIDVDRNLLQMRNDRIPNFSELGPNERFLINKIFFTPIRLLYIIGGIGVGKTSFSQFLIESVLSKIVIDTGIKSFPPLLIYYDFLEEGRDLDAFSKSEEVIDLFTNSFCDLIEAKLELYNYFSLEDEVTDIWDDLIAEYENTTINMPTAISFILSNIREREGWLTKRHTEMYINTLNVRKSIRHELRKKSRLRMSYLALLLKYIKRAYYNDDSLGVLIIVDNVDRETSLVQQTIKRLLKPFARTSQCQIVVNARQTTYYQQFDDGSSEPIDTAPYCGPTPREVINSRIDYFFDNYLEYKNQYDISFLESIRDGLRYIQRTALRSNLFTTLFDSICGNSIRKGLILAQYIVNNSVYDISSNYKTIKPTDVTRAILVGTQDVFQSSDNKIIDNLFQVEGYFGNSYLIKIRILRLLSSHKHGLKINRILDVLYGFQYDLPMICKAINELKALNKRLIWSDSVKYDFKDENDLIEHGSTSLYISTAGLGYINSLIYDLNYIQEVMLDTKVPKSFFGEGWDYSQLYERLTLVYKFLQMLNTFDIVEIRSYMSEYSITDYEYVCHDPGLITKRMFISMKHSFEKILNSIIEKDPKNDANIQFRDKYLGYFESKIIELDYFEQELWKHR